MEKYEKSCDGLPSSPKSKRGGQAFGILAISTTPIFWGLWGAFSRHVCPVTAGRNDNFAGQRSADCQLDQLRPSRSIDRRCRLDWAHAELNALRDHVRERCGQGERRRLMHLTRSGLAPGWPPWWKWLRNVIFSFSDLFCLIFSWKGRYPRPYSFFHKKDKTILFPTVYFFHTEWFLNSSKWRACHRERYFSFAKKTSFPFWGIK